MPHCPACRSTSLSHRELESALHVRSCHQCHGVWIPVESYGRWYQKQTMQPITDQSQDSDPVDIGPSPLRRCPDCTSILGRYRVGHGAHFTIDRCANCRGVWLDAAEWDALKSRNLHVRMHGLFDPAWQAKARRIERDLEEAKQQLDLLGQPDYQRVCDFRDWLREHPRRDLIWSILAPAMARSHANSADSEHNTAE